MHVATILLVAVETERTDLVALWTVLLGAAATVLLVALWSRALRRQVAERNAALEHELAQRKQAEADEQRARRERGELEEQLRHAQKMEAVGRLAGGVAHDFNNVLTIIKGYGELLAQKIGDRPELREDLDEVLGAAERAAELTRQLLAFSRRQVLPPEIVDVPGVVGGLEKMLGRLTGENVRLSLDAAPDAGAVWIGPGQLEQVVMNLAVNAVDAMPAGGELAVRVARRTLGAAEARTFGLRPGPYVALSIADTGRGMSDEVRERIFDPFFTTKAHGTGLGLSTVYGIVSQSGGIVHVDSGTGRGSRFEVLLPLARGAPAEVPEPEPEPPGARGEGAVVLLVEDEAIVRAMARAALESEGYLVLEASDGDTALTRAREHDAPIDVLVSDVVLPGMSGPETAAMLRRVQPRVALLFTSGYAGGPDAADTQVPPGAAFLQKPFSVDELRRAVRDVLAGRAEAARA